LQRRYLGSLTRVSTLALVKEQRISEYIPRSFLQSLDSRFHWLARGTKSATPLTRYDKTALTPRLWYMVRGNVSVIQYSVTPSRILSSGAWS
jgi:hypothetical protein